MVIEEVEEDWDVVSTFPPQTGDVFHGFKLEECMKMNSSCAVFVCHHIQDINQKYVTKLGIQSESNRLKQEMKHYLTLEGLDGIPQLLYSKNWTARDGEWRDTDWSQLVIEKLLNSFSHKSPNVLEVKNVLSLQQLIPIAVQQIDLLQSVHRKGLLHRGVKPDNFVMSEDRTTVYLIDFNKSKPYLDSNGRHMPLIQNDQKLPTGLPLFHSLNYFNGCRRSRRDDMESLGLCWVYLLKGRLPWSHLKYRRKWLRYVTKMKTEVNEATVQHICKDLPKSFEKYLRICREMDFYSEPNYELLRQLIANASIDPNNNEI